MDNITDLPGAWSHWAHGIGGTDAAVRSNCVEPGCWWWAHTGNAAHKCKRHMKHMYIMLHIEHRSCIKKHIENTCGCTLLTVANYLVFRFSLFTNFCWFHHDQKVTVLTLCHDCILQGHIPVLGSGSGWGNGCTLSAQPPWTCSEWPETNILYRQIRHISVYASCL